jgi:hypothetical protein
LLRPVACGSDITLTFTPTDGTTTYPTITRTFTTGARQVLLSQNFDAVTAPALPAGWTTVQLSGTAINWVTTTTTPSSPPNAAFANDPATVNLSALVSPAVAVNTTMAQITFRNQFNTETNFDGMVLEYTTNGGTTWTDVHHRRRHVCFRRLYRNFEHRLMQSASGQNGVDGQLDGLS